MWLSKFLVHASFEARLEVTKQKPRTESFLQLIVYPSQTGKGIQELIDDFSVPTSDELAESSCDICAKRDIMKHVNLDRSAEKITN